MAIHYRRLFLVAGVLTVLSISTLFIFTDFFGDNDTDLDLEGNVDGEIPEDEITVTKTDFQPHTTQTTTKKEEPYFRMSSWGEGRIINPMGDVIEERSLHSAFIDQNRIADKVEFDINVKIDSNYVEWSSVNLWVKIYMENTATGQSTQVTSKKWSYTDLGQAQTGPNTRQVHKVFSNTILSRADTLNLGPADTLIEFYARVSVYEAKALDGSIWHSEGSEETVKLYIGFMSMLFKQDGNVYTSSGGAVQPIDSDDPDWYDRKELSIISEEPLYAAG